MISIYLYADYDLQEEVLVVVKEQFQENIMLDIKKEIEKIFLEGKGDISQLICPVDDNLKELGREIITYVLEEKWDKGFIWG